MIGLKYTFTSKDGQSIVINDHTTNPDRIIALQSYPSFDVDIKNNELPREGQHGIWDFFSFYGRRVTTFQGVIVGKTEADVEFVKNQLIRVLSIPGQPNRDRDGNVRLTWTDVENKNWRIDGKLMNAIQFNRNMKENFRLDFNFSLKSASPYIVSQSQQNITGVRGYQSEGAQFPIELPTIIGGDLFNVFNIPNSGLVQSHTLIRLYGEDQGDITNPTVTDLSTGDFIKIETVIEGAANWIEINSETGSVVNQDGDDLSGLITSDSRFIMLKPGNNQLFYTSDEDPAVTLLLPTALINVRFRNTKI